MSAITRQHCEEGRRGCKPIVAGMVSIIIPVFNRRSMISETIDAALAQTYPNVEVVIVDNASTDGTWDIIQAYTKKDRRIHAFRNETNIGPVRNWKRGVDESKGEFGKILWSDDIIAPGFLEKTVPMLQSDDVGFVYTGVKIFSSAPEMGKNSYFIGATGCYRSKAFVEEALFGNGVPVSPGCALFRLYDLKKNLMVNIPNRVNSDFAMHAIGNDLLIFLLTAVQYKHFAFMSEPLSFFRAHEGSISIAAGAGRLPLHYALAKAYFVENYAPNHAPKLGAHILLLLMRYRRSLPFGRGSLGDFFENPKVNVPYMIFISLRKIHRFVFRVGRKWMRSAY